MCTWQRSVTLPLCGCPVYYITNTNEKNITKKNYFTVILIYQCLKYFSICIFAYILFLYWFKIPVMPWVHFTQANSFTDANRKWNLRAKGMRATAVRRVPSEFSSLHTAKNSPHLPVSQAVHQPSL